MAAKPKIQRWNFTPRILYVGSQNPPVAGTELGQIKVIQSAGAKLEHVSSSDFTNAPANFYKGWDCIIMGIALTGGYFALRSKSVNVPIWCQTVSAIDDLGLNDSTLPTNVSGDRFNVLRPHPVFKYLAGATDYAATSTPVLYTEGAHTAWSTTTYNGIPLCSLEGSPTATTMWYLPAGGQLEPSIFTAEYAPQNRFACRFAVPENFISTEIYNIYIGIVDFLLHDRVAW